MYRKMPFKFRIGKKSGCYELSSEVYVVSVVLPDNQICQFTLSTETTGRQCIDYLCQRINLKESAFFGLQYKSRQPTVRWVYLDHPLRRQLQKHATDMKLWFTLMFHVPDIFYLIDEDPVARKLYYLDVKKSVLDGRLMVNSAERAVLLAGYCLQAEFSDRDDMEDVVHSIPLFAKSITDSDAILDDLKRQAKNHHESLRAMPPEQAQLYYIFEAQLATGYGVAVFDAKDEDDNELKISYNVDGVTVNPNGDVIKDEWSSRWDDIVQITASKRNLIIECLTMGKAIYRMSDHEMARYVAQVFSQQFKFHRDLSRKSQLKRSHNRDMVQLMLHQGFSPLNNSTNAKYQGASMPANNGPLHPSQMNGSSRSVFEDINQLRGGGGTTAHQLAQTNAHSHSPQQTPFDLLMHGNPGRLNSTQQITVANVHVQQQQQPQNIFPPQILNGSTFSVNSTSLSANRTDVPDAPLYKAAPDYNSALNRPSIDDAVADRFRAYQANLMVTSSDLNLAGLSVHSMRSSNTALQLAESHTPQNEIDPRLATYLSNQACSNPDLRRTVLSYETIAALRQQRPPERELLMSENHATIIDPSHNTINGKIVGNVDGLWPRTDHQTDIDRMMTSFVTSEQQLLESVRPVTTPDLLNYTTLAAKSFSTPDLCPPYHKQGGGHSSRQHNENTETSSHDHKLTSTTFGSGRVLYGIGSSRLDGTKKEIDNSSSHSTIYSQPPEEFIRHIPPTTHHHDVDNKNSTTTGIIRNRQTGFEDKLAVMEEKMIRNMVAQEFSEIRFKRGAAGVSSSQIPENRVRNRVATVVPYEESRVALTPNAGNGCNGYINASKIRREDFAVERSYIAAQTPTKNTVNLFWQMVWENDCRLLILLCPESDSEAGNESPATPCYRYWPQEKGSKSSVKFGEFKISLQICTRTTTQVTRALSVKHMPTGQTRLVYQIQYLHADLLPSGYWLPHDEFDFLGFLDEVGSVRRHIEQELQQEHSPSLNLTTSSSVSSQYPLSDSCNNCNNNISGSWKRRFKPNSSRQSNQNDGNSSAAMMLRKSASGYMTKKASYMAIVHCEDGAGLTGLYILLDWMIYGAEHNKPEDIVSVLTFLRMQRMHMVQHCGQYEFVYSCLIQYLKNSRLI